MRGLVALAFITITQIVFACAALAQYRVPGYPTYVSHVTICVKRDNFLAPFLPWRCENFSARWETRGTCYVSEWMTVRMLAADANRRGYHMGARVECIAEYEA